MQKNHLHKVTPAGHIRHRWSHVASLQTAYNTFFTFVWLCIV